MRIVIIILVAFLVITSVTVHLGNEYFESDNVPLSLREIYNTLAEVGNFGDIYKGVIDDLNEVIEYLDQYTLDNPPDITDGLSLDEFWNLYLGNSIIVRIVVVAWHILMLSWSQTIEALRLVVTILSLIGKFLFGVPRPSTLMFAIA